MTSTATVPATVTPVAADDVRRTSVGLWASAATLSHRTVTVALRSGDALFAALSPVVFFICFYTPLHHRVDSAGGDYAQFLTPVILVQAGLFTAIAATEVAGSDARAGMRGRMSSLPIPRVAPVVARMVWVVVRMAISVAAGIAVGTALGFGLHGSAVDTIVFVALLVVFALSVSLLTDAVGTVVSGSAAVAGVLMIPQLILVMASTGLVPAEGFPGWAQPFVRNQPVSVLVEALRGLAAGTDVEFTAVAIWSVGLLALGVLAVVTAGRAEVRR